MLLFWSTGSDYSPIEFYSKNNMRFSSYGSCFLVRSYCNMRCLIRYDKSIRAANVVCDYETFKIVCFLSLRLKILESFGKLKKNPLELLPNTQMYTQLEIRILLLNEKIKSMNQRILQWIYGNIIFSTSVPQFSIFEFSLNGNNFFFPHLLT